MTVRPAPARVRDAAPLLLALLLPVVVLGPALGRGVVLAYDLAWSPDPRWTPFILGVGTPAPRAVPSDALAVLLGHVVGAGPAQAVVLWGVLALAGTGTLRLARLLAPGLPVAALCAAVVAATWNPFVLERLAVGQWTVLLGYAATPHLLVAASRVRAGAGSPVGLAAGVAACGAGGANTLVLAALAVGPVLLVPRPLPRALLAVGAAALLVSAAWSLPALAAGSGGGVSGADAFAPRPDTPLGTLGSLLLGGGLWNPASHPAERGSLAVAGPALLVVLAALVAAVRAARARGLPGLLAAGLIGPLLAVLAWLDPAGGWSALVAEVPGAGLLRDAQKLLAPLVVLTAAGVGVLVGGCLARAAGGSRRAVGRAAALVLALVPVLTLPSLAWGVGGRLTAVEVPDDVRRAATVLSSAPEGAVGVLPWSQYRRYAWNDGRVSLTLVPRLVGRRVLFDDSLPLRAGTVPGEDPVAARVTAALADGADPVTALRAQGVRYVVDERSSGGAGAPATPPAGARVLVRSADVLVLDLGPVPGGADLGAQPRPVGLLGWVLTGATLLGAAGIALGAASRRVRRERVTGW